MLEVEFNPQGTLAERLRAGGAGIAGFYTKTGVGTPIAQGKPIAEFDGATYLLERGIVADLALVHAHTADRFGNLRYRMAARNFNPACLVAGKIAVVQAEHISGTPLEPDDVHSPGVYVTRLVQATPREKDIERLTTRPRPEGA
jgi:3-oxoacid CoA-transferase subunit A